MSFSIFKAILIIYFRLYPAINIIYFSGKKKSGVGLTNIPSLYFGENEPLF